jgi:hypothetical protein
MLRSNSLNSRRLRRVSCGISRIVVRGYLRYGAGGDGQVVELEISLDEIREQYNNVLKANNNRSQQKKMAFLERNLEQLTNVQRGVSPPHNPPPISLFSADTNDSEVGRTKLDLEKGSRHRRTQTRRPQRTNRIPRTTPPRRPRISFLPKP